MLVVDKPIGMTSQDVINAVRRVSGTRRVGHTGTLDPLATGLLIVLLGEAVKLSEYLIRFDKEYEGTLRLGVQSDTYDEQGEVVPGPGGAIPSLDRLRELASPMTGDILQTPPPYSAVKVAGKKLYEYAREGEQVEVEPRPVRVHLFELEDLEGDTARFRIACTSGTYVRSLVHELGQAAGCGAIVTGLRRTRVGDIAITEALTLSQIEAAGEDGLEESVVPMTDALTSWPIHYVGESAAAWVRRGQAIPDSLGYWEANSPRARMGGLVFLCPAEEDAMAIARVVPAPSGSPPTELRGYSGSWLQPVKLFVRE
ncbi:tRNA pseudouridine(55) synthase TruB [Candidatus Poribacteria bacterium]|nr:tRNA pseudouridine(55) synthase TruB [Candidatus Poribacteria bacterium]